MKGRKKKEDKAAEEQAAAEGEEEEEEEFEIPRSGLFLVAATDLKKCTATGVMDGKSIAVNTKASWPGPRGERVEGMGANPRGGCRPGSRDGAGAL